MQTIARAAAARGRDFLVSQGAALEAAVVDHTWFDGHPQAVIKGLSAFQNPDGGFGKGLELDIEAPQSNPFATWMALIYLRSVPEPYGMEMRSRVAAWLHEHQADDGDWHFSEQTRAGRLAPWFAEWKFPSLNPACCLAGQASALGVATPQMLHRVDLLFQEQASLATVRDGEFYDLMPYADYSLTGMLPPNYLDELATTIIRWADEDRFEDAEHFFNLALRGSEELSARIPERIVGAYVERALEEQQADGGWPSPYDPGWRRAATAAVLSGLARALG
jgi:hypothetical protein